MFTLFINEFSSQESVIKFLIRAVSLIVKIELLRFKVQFFFHDSLCMIQKEKKKICSNLPSFSARNGLILAINKENT